MHPVVAIYVSALFVCAEIVSCLGVRDHTSHEKVDVSYFEGNSTHSGEYLPNSENAIKISSELDSNVELRVIGGDQIYYDEVYQDVQMIYPGTKWCGAGNVAANEDDLGYFEAADRCCRDHDHCGNVMSAGENKYGLNNTAFYTRVDCACDLKFYRCLKTAGTMTANQIGFAYFNMIDTKCYKEDYPIIRCHEYSSALKHRCKVYQLDKSRPKVWEWFDVPIY